MLFFGFFLKNGFFLSLAVQRLTEKACLAARAHNFCFARGFLDGNKGRLNLAVLKYSQKFWGCSGG